MIRVYMDMKGSQLYISFTNFTAGKKMVKREGRFATTKGAGHGLGLMRIDSIVERLDGYVNRNSEDGAFTTEILLPQQEEPSSGEASGYSTIENMQFVPRKRQFVPKMCRGRIFVLC